MGRVSLVNNHWIEKAEIEVLSLHLARRYLGFPSLATGR